VLLRGNRERAFDPLEVLRQRLAKRGCRVGFGVGGSDLASISDVARSFAFAAIISADSVASSNEPSESASFAISPVSSFKKRSSWSVETPSFFWRKASMRTSRELVNIELDGRDVVGDL
jgi:hypothetical protein